ncbi:hypothetical protein Tco_0854278 [Tanacetum coccineum]
MSMTIQSDVKDKILATSSESPGKANVVIEALSRKERVKPRRVRTRIEVWDHSVWSSEMILAAQRVRRSSKNVLAERLHGLD